MIRTTAKQSNDQRSKHEFAGRRMLVMDDGNEHLDQLAGMKASIVILSRHQIIIEHSFNHVQTLISRHNIHQNNHSSNQEPAQSM